jgi:hypothetical protein
MARFGDRGAYAIGNVRICTVTENHKEVTGRPNAELAERNRRRWLDPEYRQRMAATLSATMSATNRRRWAVWNRHLTEQHVQAAIAVATRVSL